MKQQEERIAMRSIKRLSNGISREMCAAFGSGMFSGAQGRTLHFLLAEHTKSDVFQKDIEAEFGLRPPTATALLKELEQRGTPQPYTQVLSDILQRDWADSQRETAPLRQAEDALLLDTSHLDFDQSREALLHMIKERIGW